MTISISSLPLSDAKITAVKVGREDVSVELNLWNDERMVLIFRNVSGIEAFAPLGEEISDCYEALDAAILKNARNREDDPTEAASMKCYIFRSAVDGTSVLSVVAEYVEKAN